MITRGFFNISPSVKIRNAPKAALLRRFPHYLFCPSCPVVKALMLGNRAFFATFNPLKVAKGSSAKRFCNLFPCSQPQIARFQDISDLWFGVSVTRCLCSPHRPTPRPQLPSLAGAEYVKRFPIFATPKLSFGNSSFSVCATVESSSVAHTMDHMIQPICPRRGGRGSLS